MRGFTALGDSITAGRDATSPGRAYPGLTASLLGKTGRPVVAHVLAEPGWTSAALTAAVLENPVLPLRRSDAVVIWVGGDDLAYAGLRMLRGAPSTTVAQALATYADDLAFLCRFIRKVSKARILVCTQYNPFPNSPLAGGAIGKLNHTTEQVAAAAGAELVPVHTWFSGRQREFIAGYRSGRLEDALASPVLPIHPNDAGHRTIAEHLAHALAMS
ncbi:SGNH/GDSL hydrolase family protein [Alicyclobacillus shizuokensis]|uniref:SGNH/GDSL hydrolase family protein n=1 Tax=Alicyclobacillus shizuokensis TaxID=392014 RepID=UPI0008369947|nr:SGNH/GDSL hydrolase family protein [Alicyclobacillus shizuokensis]MCL6625121.1 SGNH/GDSL hydrolase family protein [Alicyclobacillus shizuokensis]